MLVDCLENAREVEVAGFETGFDADLGVCEVLEFVPIAEVEGMDLAPRVAESLGVLIEFQRSHGFYPSARELGALMEMRSPKTGHKYLQKLLALGLIGRVFVAGSAVPRGFEVLKTVKVQYVLKSTARQNAADFAKRQGVASVGGGEIDD